MKRTPSDWRLVALGLTCAAILCAAFALTPAQSAGADTIADDITKDLYRAVASDDATALRRARQRVRRVAHKDLLLRSVPAMLKLMDALAATGRHCDVAQNDAFRRGVCHLRRQQFGRALVAFAAVDRRVGGATYRDVTVRLLAEHRAHRSIGARTQGVGP